MQDPEPHLYLYAQKMGEHRQIGVVACASVAEYVADVIKKHEKTRADKEDDRTRHIEELARARRAGVPHLPRRRRASTRSSPTR